MRDVGDWHSCVTPPPPDRLVELLCVENIGLDRKMKSLPCSVRNILAIL